ncbi:RNA-directed DNA polymerase, eukaryota, partial [Tanacetum coccineum]
MSHKRFLDSNEDFTQKISHSIFVTNFPDSINSRDLWRECSVYGTVVDVFIPSKKSKAGKRFAFVRFIKVFNLERLVKNLCTLWIGRYHLYANQVRFDRPHKHVPHNKVNFPPLNGSNRNQGNANTFLGSKQKVGGVGSYVKAVNGGSSVQSEPLVSSVPALVLDEECCVERDFSKCAMGKVKDVNSILNLQNTLVDEGFEGVRLFYLGGKWVMFEFAKEDTKVNLMKHIGVNSWFTVIQDVIQDFASEERVVWVDIEGVPLHAWSRETFARIGKKWGETLSIEDTSDFSFGRKRLCIITKHPVSIFESFKVKVKGKVFMVRAKELFTWNPFFKSSKEKDYSSDDDSVHSEGSLKVQSLLSEEEEGEFNLSSVEGVAETIFGDNADSPLNQNEDIGVKQSADSFEFYELLNRKNTEEVTRNSSPSLSHPLVLLRVSQWQRIIEIMVVHEEISGNSVGHVKAKSGESVLGILEEVIRVGQAMGFSMGGCLGNKTKKEWVKELINKNNLNFIAIQETKMEKISHMDVKFMWGNSNYDFVCSDSLGNSGGIICIWEKSFFKKEHVTISDNFIAIYGTWIPNKVKILMVAIYAPQQPSNRRILWEYMSIVLGRWNGESILMGDFNEVRSKDERRGSWFNAFNARLFEQFISSSGLIDVKMEGYAFTWSHPSAQKMSKLDRFLVSDGVISLFPFITSVCLDRHLSDHRPILLCEVRLDYGPIPFRTYHSWFSYEGFDDMVKQTWNSFAHSDRNSMIRFKKKLQDLKKSIRSWIRDKKIQVSSSKSKILDELRDIDRSLDQGIVSDMLLLKRQELKQQLNEIKTFEAKDSLQKSKVRWAIEGDENSKYFHGIINKKRSLLAIRGVFDDGSWLSDPSLVKKAFLDHYGSRFKKPTTQGLKFNFSFPNRLSQDQVDDLERDVSRDEIRSAVWDCGENKSPGPDGFTFEFFRRYWELIGPDFCAAVEHFFENRTFSKGCNSSFIALIPKVSDAKFVNEYRPISLIGSVYKVVTKIMANRLSMVIAGIVSDSQSAFVAERQILDGPFILNEILHWCKRKRKKAMFFKVDFAKAYDSVRWDFLLDVLEAFGFGSIWCDWIR